MFVLKAPHEAFDFPNHHDYFQFQRFDQKHYRWCWMT